MTQEKRKVLEQAESAMAQQIKVLWLSLFVDLCDPLGGVGNPLPQVSVP